MNKVGLAIQLLARQPSEFRVPSVEAATVRELKNERLRALIAEVRGPATLHVGCVDHRLPLDAAEATYHLHYQLCRIRPELDILGLDINAEAVEELNAMGMRSVVGDAQYMGFHQEFDTILAGELIEHLENPGLFLQSCRLALRQGGLVVISTPNVFSPMFALMYAKRFDKAFNPEHTQWFCPQTITKLVRRSGLKLTSLRFVDDLRPEVVKSAFYKLFVFGWRIIRSVLPRRYRNTMVVICELA